MKDIKARLYETAKALQTHLKVADRLKEIDLLIERENKQLTAMTDKLDKEAEDIATLEKMSLKSIFHKVLGSKEEQIEKERQEYLQLSLQYDEAKKSMELLEYEREILEKKYQKGTGLQGEYDNLVRLREKEILTQQPRLAQQVHQIDREIQQSRRMIFEIDEALSVGQDALELLDRMTGYLNQAKNWGRWDMAGRRRGYAGHMKHSSIDRAKEIAYKLKYILPEFERELKDVYQKQSFDLRLNFDSFSSFVDIFFDNLLTDWLVQQKIQNTQNSVRSVRDKVLRLMHSLKAELPMEEARMLQFEQKRKELIASA